MDKKQVFGWAVCIFIGILFMITISGGIVTLVLAATAMSGIWLILEKMWKFLKKRINNKVAH